MGAPLDGIHYISIRELKPRMIGDFLLNPEILLPVETTGAGGQWSPQSISWEAIVSGMLKLLAFQPQVEHADYYRRFILAVKPDLKEEFTSAGIIKTRNGELELAVDIFRALAGVFPDCASTCNNLALVYEQLARKNSDQGQLEVSERYLALAFDAYKRAIQIDSELAGAHFNFGHFYLRRRNLTKAREHFDKYLALDPGSGQSAAVKELLQELDDAGSIEQICSRAFDSISLNRERDAVGALRDLTGRHPEIWNAWFLLGWAHRRLGEYAMGREALEKAHSLKPGEVDTLNELAICLMEEGHYAASHSRLSEAVRLEPENPKLVSNLGILALRMGRSDEAREHFEKVLARSPEDPLAREYLRRLSSGEL
jgi:tetratricopeptide (TPR) repeat protein